MLEIVRKQNNICNVKIRDMSEKHLGTAQWVAKKNESRQRMAEMRTWGDDELLKYSERLFDEMERVMRVLTERNIDIAIDAPLIEKTAHRVKKLP